LVIVRLVAVLEADVELELLGSITVAPTSHADKRDREQSSAGSPGGGRRARRISDRP
jgi:hypothetical protein